MIFSLFDFPIKAARIHIKKSVKLMNVTQCKLQISFSTESNIEYRETLLQWYSNVEISWFYLANIGPTFYVSIQRLQYRLEDDNFLKDDYL